MNPISGQFFGSSGFPQANPSRPMIPHPMPPNDGQVVKDFLQLVTKGNLGEIINYIGIHKLDITKIVDGNFRHTCLFYACLIPDPEMAYQVIKVFIERGVTPTYTDVLNQTVLYYAAREGKVKCAQYLLSLGSEANHRDQYGQTPLYYSAREGHYELTKMLLDAGSNVNNIDNNGQSALFYSAREGRRNICELLISYGIDINRQDNHKQTALHWAKKYNRTTVVDLFVAHGAIVPKEIPKAVPKEKASKKGDKKHKKPPTDINSVNKYILTIYRDGQWRRVTQEEFKEFEDNHNEVARYFKKPSLLSTIKPPLDPQANITYHWDKAATKILNHMWKLQGACHFHHPVDYVAMNILDYPQIITHPMDFGTIKNKLEIGDYNGCREFVNDMELVFRNCIIYNTELSDFGQLAKRLQNEFNNQCKINYLDFYMT